MPSSELNHVTFPSKRDWWIVALIWVGALLALFAGFDQLSGAGSPALRGSFSLLCVAIAGFMIWVLYRTEYVLTMEDLLVRCGPFRYRIPLAGVDSVTPSRNPLSSPACSLDRLLIKWEDGRRQILISPDPKADFLRVLAQRCAQLTLQGERLVRSAGE